MFGLMRPERKCSDKTSNDYRYHRMHYCGTCKTLGRQYGQRTRTLLNFDTVFFAEILSHLSKENLAGWQDAYQAINQCFKIPAPEETLPISLEYAAATNVLLGELKLDDHSKDLPGMKWTFARRLFSKSFRKARRQFEDWGIDTRLFWQWIKKQEVLEGTVKSDFPTLENLLAYYAEPTAQMTALIFENGATTIGQQEYSAAMHQLGYQFGRLIYILDAFEDIEKDIFRRQFNPLVRFYNTEETLRENQLEEVRQVILAAQQVVAEQLEKLPFTPEITEQYSVRLYSNIIQRIYKERVVPKNTASQIRVYWQSAMDMAGQTFRLTTTWARTANYYLVSLVLFVFPAGVEQMTHSNQGEVYKWTAVFSTVLAAIGLGKYAIARRKKRKAKRNERRAKRKIRRAKRKVFFLLRLKNLFAKKLDCWSDCCSSCCESCFQEFCDICCNEIWASIGEGKLWPWALLFGICALIALLIIFV